MSLQISTVWLMPVMVPDAGRLAVAVRLLVVLFVDVAVAIGTLLLPVDEACRAIHGLRIAARAARVLAATVR